MHTLTVQTKFTFGDHVRFDSRAQGFSGSGTVFAITVDSEYQIDYTIAIPDGEYVELQGGIYEDEITELISPGET